MEVLKYDAFMENVFFDAHSAVSRDDLVPYNDLVGQKGFATAEEFETAVEFMKIDPDYVYYNPSNRLYPIVYWKDFVFYIFMGDLSIKVLEMTRADKAIEQYTRQMDTFLKEKDYESIFMILDKKALIGTYIEKFEEIPDNQKYEIFAALYVRSEFGFEMFDDDFLSKVFSKRFLSAKWEERMKTLNDIVKPDEEGNIIAYRGEGPAEDILSWTLSEKTAKFFAKRFGRNGKVLKEKIALSIILDYLDMRG